MLGKRLSSAQCRFLGDHLKMEGFERLLVDSPLRFLEYLVPSFKRGVPFSLLSLQASVKRTGKIPNFSFAESQLEILSGRGGGCLQTTPFLEDFLLHAGFNAHLIHGYSVARATRRDALHGAIIVRNVEREGDAYLLDVGHSVPVLRVPEVTHLLNGVDDATPILRSCQMRYQMVKVDRLRRTFDYENGDDLQFDRKISSRFDLPRLEAEFCGGGGDGDDDGDDDGGDDALVTMVAKDDYIAATIPHIADEPDGVWLPLQVYPTPLARFDLDVAMENIRGEQKTAFVNYLWKCAVGGVYVSGFGRKTGDFILVHGDHCVRCLGSRVEELGGARREEESTSTEEAATATKGAAMAPTGDVSAAAAKATRFGTEATTLESDEEILSLMEEEFPTMTDYCKDALEMWQKRTG